MKDKIIYIMYADTFQDCWGVEIEVFGVADNKTDRDKICDAVTKKGYFVQVEELTLNQYCRKYLGGHYE